MTEAENRPGRAAEDAPEAAGLKRQLLLRAGVAASLIVVLLAGLAVYERMHRVAPSPPAAPSVQAPTAPPTMAEAGPAAAPAGEPDGPAETEAVPGRDAPPEPELAGAPELAPPGQRQADAPAPQHGTPRLVLGGEPAPPQQPAGRNAKAPSPEAPAVAATPAPAPPPPEAARPATGKKGYLVQVGFFTSPDNAEALRARLEQLGIPARLESRVVMGPFPDQAAARAAQARLREAGESPGLIVAPRR